MRIEQIKKAKLADLDSALLSLKHSITENVKGLSSGDMLSEIGLNVLKRAQSVRDSLVKNMWQAKPARRKVSVKAKKAAAPKAKTSKRKTTAARKKKTSKKK